MTRPALLRAPEQRALLVSRVGLIVGWSVWLTVVPLQACNLPVISP